MQDRRWKWSTALVGAVVAALALVSCGGENVAPPPPERFRPAGYEVRIEGERMFATTAQAHACRELGPLVREPAAQTQLLSERVLVVECTDRWLRMELDVQSGEAVVVGGVPENAEVVDAALWRREHAALHDAAVAASRALDVRLERHAAVVALPCAAGAGDAPRASSETSTSPSAVARSVECRPLGRYFWARRV